MAQSKLANKLKKTRSNAEGGKGMAVLIAFLVIFLVAMAAVYAYVAIQDGYDKEFISLVGEKRLLSQQITKFAGQTSHGDETAFNALRSYRDQFAAALGLIRDGNPATGMPPVPAELQSQSRALMATWTEFNRNIDIILERRELVGSLRETVEAISTRGNHLLALSDEVATLLTQSDASGEQVYIASRQLMLSQRIMNNVNHVLEGGQGSVTAADRFGRDATLFGRVVDGMLNGNPTLGIERVSSAEARAKLEEVRTLFADVSSQVSLILERSPEMFQVSAAVFEVLALSDELLAALSTLEQAYIEHAQRRPVNTMLGSLFGVIALALLLFLGATLRRDGLQRLEAVEADRRKSEEVNMRNQQAIMRLLDEMGDLADGDLTVNATVTEDMTGAIADSINYAIDTLRSLVAAIDQTAAQIAVATQQSKATAVHLAEASEHQVQEITRTTDAVNEMAHSIEGVSKHSEALAREAQVSVDTATQGSLAVQKTIEGMNHIREQIQETSKRIKRLGESSQEIGDIVELINDIAEQTNILALNAAIQAAMAGESGRGFAVVADEVQRLAERSADATKQIDGLVKTIQADTNEAVISMEESTSEVVAGARLAEDAGAALEKIDTVANHLAKLVQNISAATRKQANAAARISQTMGVIKEITIQTSEGTERTTQSVADLAAMAEELKKSVAGFKLP